MIMHYGESSLIPLCVQLTEIVVCSKIILVGVVDCQGKQEVHYAFSLIECCKLLHCCTHDAFLQR